MTSGTRLALVVVGAALAIAALRTCLLPVGSFREGLDLLTWGIEADSVQAILGRPDRICTHPVADHLIVDTADPDRARGAVARATGERWIYTERPPPDRPPVDDRPECRPPPAGTELGFDPSGRLRWISRETLQTPVELDPGIRASIDTARRAAP